MRATTKKSSRHERPTARTRKRAAARKEISSIEVLARRFAQLASNKDPAFVAGAIAIFATKTIERSASNLAEARAYLDGLRGAIDGLLRNRFEDDKPRRSPR